MAGYRTIVSSARIGREEWLAFLRVLGAELIQKPRNPYDAALTSDDGTIWVGIDDGVIEDLDLDDPTLLRALGGAPQTTIVVELGRQPGSRALAQDFMSQLTQRWPCAIVDEDA